MFVLIRRHEPGDISFISDLFRHIWLFLHLIYRSGTLSFRSLPAQFVASNQIRFLQFFFKLLSQSLSSNSPTGICNISEKNVYLT
jgi:hypothetical protein